jgi:hypothetical protein
MSGSRSFNPARWRGTIAITLVTTICSVLALWRVADARTYRCLKAERCPPPPCDYFRQLEMWTALKSVYGDTALHEKMRRDAGRADPTLRGEGLEKRAARLLDAEVRRQAGRGGSIQRHLRECPGSPIAEPPSLQTTPECLVVDQAAPANGLNRQRAHEQYSTCREFINAIFDHEDVHLEHCSGARRMSSLQRENMGVAAFGAEEAEGYEAAIRRAKSGLQWWAATCANNIDRETRRELINQGITLLAGSGG